MMIKINDTFFIKLYGETPDKVKLLAIHEFGTIDVERLSDNKCFRITGLQFKTIEE